MTTVKTEISNLLGPTSQIAEILVKSTSVTVNKHATTRPSNEEVFFIPAVFLGVTSTACLLLAGLVTTGVIAGLITTALMSLRYYRSHQARGGANAVVAAAIALVYAIGVAPREFPVFSVEVSQKTQLLLLLGTALFCISLATFGAAPFEGGNANSHSDHIRRPPAFSIRSLVPLISIGIVGALLNYATGDIPLLSSDINGSRLNGNYGILGRLWPIFLPLLQIGVISGITLLARRKATRAALWLSSTCAFLLFLNGGRSLLLICLLAGALVWVELWRPRLWILGVGAAIGASVVGIIGFVRTQASGGRDLALQYLNERNLDSSWGSLDLSLQTGPRVLDLASSPATSFGTNGSILFGDILNFFDSSVQRSDRLVTEAIGRDPLVLGGMPPTIWGGLLLEYGVLGLIFGTAVIAWLVISFSRMLRKRDSIYRDVWYGYFSAYVLLGSYSYFSFRPSWITVAVALGFAAVLDHELGRVRTKKGPVGGQKP